MTKAFCDCQVFVFILASGAELYGALQQTQSLGNRSHSGFEVELYSKADTLRLDV